MDEELLLENDALIQAAEEYAHYVRIQRLKAVFVIIMLIPTIWLFAHAFRLDQPAAEPAHVPPAASEKVILPVFEEDVLLCSSTAKMEYDKEISIETACQSGDPYRPFLFEYRLRDQSGKFILDESPDFTAPREYIMPASETHITVDNLKVNTTYYYKVIVEGQEYPGSFHTARSTRYVTIPGLFNTRDIGGYTTLDGKTIKQGLLIRGIELDGLEEPTYYIPQDELENVQKEFGFAFDMDLRGSGVYYGEYVSRLGIPHQFFGAPQYGQIFAASYQESLRQIFAALADPNKYPMYMHCTYGTDRTGTIVFLLQGVLNVSQEDMVLEYCRTSYAAGYALNGRKMDVIINMMSRYSGDTLQEQIVTYLTEVIGVTPQQIASIRNIYLE